MLYKVHKLIFKKNLSSRYAPDPPVPAPVPALDSCITTSTNMAYEMTKQGAQGGEQEGEHEYEVVSPLRGPPAGKVRPPPQQRKAPMTYYEVPSLPAIQQPVTAGGTEGDVVYEIIS